MLTNFFFSLIKPTVDETLYASLIQEGLDEIADRTADDLYREHCNGGSPLSSSGSAHLSPIPLHAHGEVKRKRGVRDEAEGKTENKVNQTFLFPGSCLNLLSTTIEMDQFPGTV